MSCCGNKRESLSHSGYPADTNHSRPNRMSGSIPAYDNNPTIRFQYVGRTGLTVLGPMSGKHYRFDKPGAQLVVDPRDRASLLLVPNLWEVSDYTTGSGSL